MDLTGSESDRGAHLQNEAQVHERIGELHEEKAPDELGAALTECGEGNSAADGG